MWKIALICRKMVLMNPVENELVDTVGEGEGGTNWESSIDIYALSCVKQWVGSCYITQGACPGTLWWLRGVGLGRGGRTKREGICI